MKDEKYRIVFFNPVTLRKHDFTLSFTWDNANHCWFFNDSRRFYGKPIDEVERTANMLHTRTDEYVTIKRVAY